MKQTANQAQNVCPCQSGKPYVTCCQPFHAGTPASTAEALMRSRYSAYVLKLEAYLLATWHTETRPQSLNLADDAIKWLGLDIKHTETKDKTAVVEFLARYRVGGGKAERLHEISQFQHMNGHWYYVTGT